MFVKEGTSTVSPVPFNVDSMIAANFPDRIYCNTQLVATPAVTKFVKSAPVKNVKSKKLDKFQQIPLTWLQVFKLFHKSHQDYPHGLVVNIGSGVGVCC